MSLNKIKAVLIKEGRYILRTPGTLILLLLAPVILMIIFSYALATDIKQTPIIAIDNSRSALSRRLLDLLAHNEALTLQGLVPDYEAAGRYFDRGQTKGLVVIPNQFSERLRAGRPVEIQLIVDGTDPTTAEHVINHVLSRSQAFGLEVAGPTTASGSGSAPAGQISGRPPSDPITLKGRVWYNPALKNTHGVIPALIPIVLSLPAIVVMNALVREKENNSLEGLFATPLSRAELLIGKIIPYLGAGLVSAVTCTLIAIYLFGVPFRGGFPLFLLLAFDCLLAAFTMGIFLATFISNQAVASVIGLLTFLLPGFFLTGVFYPVSNFPDLIQQEVKTLPATHFVAITRGLMVKGQGLAGLWEPALMLLGIAGAMTLLAVFFFRRKVA
jgi:ABC-2 type transport system permease protein